MAASKKKKIIQKEIPVGRKIEQSENPDKYYAENPAWAFVNIDNDMWAFTKENIDDSIWTEIIPFLKSLESQTWNEILIRDKKKNHSIQVKDLNKIAQERLIMRFIEAESLISLRITGKHRLYGYMTGRAYNILWYDDNHGDNETCVCKSNLKHT